MAGEGGGRGIDEAENEDERALLCWPCPPWDGVGGELNEAEKPPNICEPRCDGGQESDDNVDSERDASEAEVDNDIAPAVDDEEVGDELGSVAVLADDDSSPCK